MKAKRAILLVMLASVPGAFAAITLTGFAPTGTSFTIPAGTIPIVLSQTQIGSQPSYFPYNYDTAIKLNGSYFSTANTLMNNTGLTLQPNKIFMDLNTSSGGPISTASINTDGISLIKPLWPGGPQSSSVLSLPKIEFFQDNYVTGKAGASYGLNGSSATQYSVSGYESPNSSARTLSSVLSPTSLSLTTSRSQTSQYSTPTGPYTSTQNWYGKFELDVNPDNQTIEFNGQMGASTPAYPAPAPTSITLQQGAPRFLFSASSKPTGTSGITDYPVLAFGGWNNILTLYKNTTASPFSTASIVLDPLNSRMTIDGRKVLTESIANSNSYALGAGTTAYPTSQVVLGKYNQSTTDTNVFVVGNGLPGAPKNAITVDAIGTTLIGGTTVAGTLAVTGNISANTINASGAVSFTNSVNIGGGASVALSVQAPATFNQPIILTGSAIAGDIPMYNGN